MATSQGSLLSFRIGNLFTVTRDPYTVREEAMAQRGVDFLNGRSPTTEVSSQEALEGDKVLVFLDIPPTLPDALLVGPPPRIEPELSVFNQHQLQQMAKRSAESK